MINHGILELVYEWELPCKLERVCEQVYVLEQHMDILHKQLP